MNIAWGARWKAGQQVNGRAIFCLTDHSIASLFAKYVREEGAFLSTPMANTVPSNRPAATCLKATGDP